MENSIKKLQEFLSEQMMPQLDQIEKSINALEEELKDNGTLRQSIADMMNLLYLQNLTSRVDIGLGVFARAVILDASEVNVRINENETRKMKLDEAFAFALQRERALARDILVGRERAAHIRANIKIMQQGLHQLLNG